MYASIPGLLDLKDSDDLAAKNRQALAWFREATQKIGEKEIRNRIGHA